MLPQSAKVLVVDDMGTMRKYVRQCLADVGLTQVEEADDGDTAWSQLVSGLETGRPFQLVITDWNMPRVQGIDFLRMIRFDERTKSLPVLMVTAEGNQNQIIEAMQAGVSAYLVKPFTPDTLIERLQLAIRASESGI